MSHRCRIAADATKGNILMMAAQNQNNIKLKKTTVVRFARMQFLLVVEAACIVYSNAARRQRSPLRAPTVVQE